MFQVSLCRTLSISLECGWGIAIAQPKGHGVEFVQPNPTHRANGLHHEGVEPPVVDTELDLAVLLHDQNDRQALAFPNHSLLQHLFANPFSKILSGISGDLRECNNNC